MGAIHFSIDTGMIRALQTALPLETFVETGTFEGASVQAARPLFKKIITVELSGDLHKAAEEKFRGDLAVEVFMGNSPDVLKNLRPRLEKEPVLYWLDAHWCMAEGDTAGAKSQCPLLTELDAIGTLNEKSVLLIDDARLFLSTPPSPHETSDWPKFDAIVRKLFALSTTHALSVINDVIAYVPHTAVPALREYARHYSPDLLVELRKAAQFDALKKDRDELVANTERLATELNASNTDRAARLEAIEKLESLLKETSARLAESEADRAARLSVIEDLAAKLAVSEADRAARLEVIERQDQLLKEQADASGGERTAG